jgi:hypothetical protein
MDADWDRRKREERFIQTSFKRVECVEFTPRRNSNRGDDSRMCVCGDAEKDHVYVDEECALISWACEAFNAIICMIICRALDKLDDPFIIKVQSKDENRYIRCARKVPALVNITFTYCRSPFLISIIMQLFPQ